MLLILDQKSLPGDEQAREVFLYRFKEKNKKSSTLSIPAAEEQTARYATKLF